MLQRILNRLGFEARIDGSCRRGFGLWIDEVDPGLVLLLWSRELRLQRVEEARRARAQASAARAVARWDADQRRRGVA